MTDHLPPGFRVIITKPVVQFAWSQVCAVRDATDAEILDTCNRLNRPGTDFTWTRVVRGVQEGPQPPIPCERFADRVHLLVGV